MSSLIDALLSGPPRTPTRLFFAATVEDWHYAADGYIGDVGFDDRVARLAAHVGETALVTESHRLEYCADPNDASTCLRSLKDHLSGDFSACNLTSAVTASYFEFRDVGDASAMELASFLHDEVIALAPLGPAAESGSAWVGLLTLFDLLMPTRPQLAERSRGGAGGSASVEVEGACSAQATNNELMLSMRLPTRIDQVCVRANMTADVNA